MKIEKRKVNEFFLMVITFTLADKTYKVGTPGGGGGAHF